MKKTLVLCILDGVGIAAPGPHNAVSNARMPFYKSLFEKYPHTELKASGPAVGLLPGTMGNSEVGHITIGSGRVVDQFLRRFKIEKESGRIASNPHLERFIAELNKTGGAAHILGLSSGGCVHSDINQAIYIAKIICAANIPIVWHFVSDGRDTPPQSALKYIRKLEREFRAEIKSGQFRFGTLCGRYYAMDRNNNWGRTKLALDAVMRARAPCSAKSIKSALSAAYARGESDEFIKPVIIGAPAPFCAKDGLLFTNYRDDRARQILKMFARLHGMNNSRVGNVLCFSEYGEGLNKYFPALLSDVKIRNTFGDIVAAAGLSQLRVAETTKYNHATYFFDAERTMNYPRGKKILIPSPNVATFDMAPEMSAEKITDALIPLLSEFDVIILNYANGDEVGHTGNMPAAVKALEILDACMARFVPAVLDLGGCVLITADHGNAEEMWDEKNDTFKTSHTTNKVPFIIVRGDLPDKACSSVRKAGRMAKTGGLSDIAPTMLKILGLPKPKEMTGKSLI
ncbi:MAG: 2,3-bisphosphoglycerate-independent phosphoglycerate mutase [Alphaproteobacteria bacterium]|nr:2,3-bisphosphoglycerate-independent phosphoglycerate mutase [Alphaproteobacteria bacterium]